MEIHTGSYANNKKNNYLREIKSVVKVAMNNNISVRAGHGLNFDNVKNIVKISGIEELNIGHFIIGEAIFDGLENVIAKMLKLMKKIKYDFRNRNRYMRSK